MKPAQFQRIADRLPIEMEVIRSKCRASLFETRNILGEYKSRTGKVFVTLEEAIYETAYANVLNSLKP